MLNPQKKRFIWLIYKLHIFLDRKISEVFQVLISISLLVKKYIYINEHNKIKFHKIISWSDFFKENKEYIIAIGLWFLLRIVIFLFIKKSGGNFSKNLSSYFNTQKKQITITSSLENKEVENNFATMSDLDALSKINLEAYSGTLWYLKKAEKSDNFSAHIGKNEFSIRVVKENISKEGGAKITAYTHAVPVNLYTFNKFLNGSEKELDFTEHSVITSKTDVYKDDIPYGIIFFSACAPTKLLPLKGRKKRNEKISKSLCECMAKHLLTLVEKYFKSFKVVPVVFQTLDPEVIKRLGKNIISKKTRSRENGRIILVELLNSTPQELKKHQTECSIKV